MKKKRDKQIQFRTTQDLMEQLSYIIENDKYNRNKTQIIEGLIKELYREMIKNESM